MVLKNVSRILLCVIIACAGCKKSETPPPPAAPEPVTNSVAANAIATNASPIAPTTLVSRIHWLGKKKIAADTNSASLMAIWNLPESTRLEEQTLDKLSRNLLAGIAADRGENPQSTNLPFVANATNPPSILATNQLSISNQVSAFSASSNRPPASNDVSAFRVPSSAFLRPLLDDLLNEESYFEIRGKTNGPQEWIFAIRLDAARAALWETNFNDLRARTNTLQSAFRVLRSAMLSRSGDWTILASTGRADRPAGRGLLLDEVLARVEKTHIPFTPGATNWLDSDIYFDQFASILHLPSSVFDQSLSPRLFLAVDGDGKNVLTHGQLTFATPPPLKWEPWNIPTNLISPIFSSFTVARGFGPLLQASAFWSRLSIGNAPNQLFCWAIPGTEITTYFAAPLVNASNKMSRIADMTIEYVNPWLSTNGSPITRTAQFQKSQTFTGIECHGIPFASPFLRSIALTNGDFIIGGFFPPAMNRRPMPVPLLQELARTNLVYYDWEATGPRLESLLHMFQFFRIISNRPQLAPGMATVPWLQTVQPKLGDTLTEVIALGSNRFQLSRKSNIGFTAVELHLLTDWLESPNFPIGLYSTRAQMPAHRPLLPHKTSSATPAPPPGT